MNYSLLLTNLALRLGSPTGHAILIALALLFIAPMAHAMEILVLDDPNCRYCKRFKSEVGAEYNDSDLAAWAPLVYVDHSVGYIARPDLWPVWFKEARDEGRIGLTKHWPTFIFYDTLPGRTTPQEVARLKGYGGREWFYDRVNFIRETYEAWKKSPPP
jgi:hypothetical protein